MFSKCDNDILIGLKWSNKSRWLYTRRTSKIFEEIVDKYYRWLFSRRECKKVWCKSVDFKFVFYRLSGMSSLIYRDSIFVYVSSHAPCVIDVRWLHVWHEASGESFTHDVRSLLDFRLLSVVRCDLCERLITFRCDWRFVLIRYPRGRQNAGDLRKSLFEKKFEHIAVLNIWCTPHRT